MTSEQSPALLSARLELARAQLIAQIGSDEDFERVVAAQETALREARKEQRARLTAIDNQLRALHVPSNGLDA